MYKKVLVIITVFMITSACTGDGELNTSNLTVERKDNNTIYKPVGKNIAEDAIPFDVKFPAYFPFKHEETKAFITGWENSKTEIVLTIKYPSIEENAKWKEGSFTQPAIPHVTYIVANFDRYYSRYSDTGEYQEIEIKEGIKGLFKVNREMSGAELHWFHKDLEYNLYLNYFSKDSRELKEELVKIADSI